MFGIFQKKMVLFFINQPTVHNGGVSSGRDLECPKPVRFSLFYDWKSYLSTFGRGGFVKAGEEKDEKVNQFINDGGVCRAAPGLAEVCE